MKKRKIFGLITAFVMVFTMTFANAGAVFAVSLNEMEAGAQNIEFGKQYTASWTAENADEELYSKITVPTAGIVGITATKPADADGNIKLDMMMYDEDGSSVWGSECTYTVDKEGGYEFNVGLLPGTYYLAMKPGTESVSGTVQTDFSVSFAGNLYAEREPNTTGGDATQIDMGHVYTGFFGSDGAYKSDENDIYKVDFIKGYTYKITIGNYKAMKKTSALVEVKDPAGFEDTLKLKLDNAVDASGNSIVTFKAVTTGVHYIKFSNYNQAQIGYTVKVDQVSPAAVADCLRLCGTDRYDTAIAAANHLKKIKQIRKFDNVIVASGKNFPDALAGGYLAGVKNAPVLLVSDTAAVEDKIAGYIKETMANSGTVYILGGTKAVSSRFESLLKGYSVKRIYGADRYATNLKILDAAGTQNADLLVCTGTGYADSLSASATGIPMLLVSGNSLTSEQKKYIGELNPDNIYVIGGTGAVKQSVEDELKTIAENVERVYGADRYKTSVAVAKAFFPEECSNIVYAYARNFPDGLSGGPLAMSLNGPVVLTDTANSSAADTYSAEAGVDYGVVLGGTGQISDAAIKKILAH